MTTNKKEKSEHKQFFAPTLKLRLSITLFIPNPKTLSQKFTG
jgi:hypothetical protein